jgi:(E)-4-hydroxy-3-methylbut-2-enyl-diphosphate synthase
VARKLVDYAARSAQVRASARIENGILYLEYNDSLPEDFQLHAAMDAGALLIDGKAGDLRLTNPNMNAEQIRSTEEAILQGARIRFSKPEYISCPGCGRTLYNLEDTIARIKAATGHLKGVKIAIMGCIVNGPGEMADADFGYVGAGRGKISLYKGKECIEKNIPEENAVDRLLKLIEATLHK